MALKRKLVEDASESVQSSAAKQMKLVPFPSSQLDATTASDMDVDMTMSDSPVMDVDAFNFPLPYHTRLASSASTDSSASSDYASDASSPPDSAELNVAQPATLNGRLFLGLGFPHLRQGCKQIPKLRVACGSGISGRRSMWGICEECGAVQMLDS